MKLALYTITYSGGYYDGPALTLEEIIRLVRSLGYNGVEVEGKRPHGSPLDLDEKACVHLRKLAESEDVEIPAVSAYNDFSSPIEEHRQNELLMIRELIRMASYLGAPVVRVFTAWSGVTLRNGLITYDVARYNIDHRYPGTTELERWNYVRDCLAEAAEIAGSFGVKLALQNHAPIIHTYEDVLAFVNEVNSPNLGVCLDAPLMYDQSDEWVECAVRETGDLIILSHFGGEYEETADGKVRPKMRSILSRSVNYPAFIRAAKDIGYDGYLGYELCHPVVENHRHVGIKEVHLHAKLACRYMRRIIMEQMQVT